MRPLREVHSFRSGTGDGKANARLLETGPNLTIRSCDFHGGNCPGGQPDLRRSAKKLPFCKKEERKSALRIPYRKSCRVTPWLGTALATILPRLSVDIDLVYVPIADRVRSLAAIGEASVCSVLAHLKRR